jgi:hypothetical protein
VPDYITVYQISTQPPLAPDWLLAYAGLVPLIVGAVIILGKYRFGWRRPGWPFPLFCCFVGIVLFLIAGPLITGISSMNSGSLTASYTGRYSTVEGVSEP